MMKSRGLILGLLVLAVTVGLLLWSNRESSEKSSTAASVDSAPKILALNQADIVRLEIRNKGAEGTTLTRNNSGEWGIIAPQEYAADSNAVSGLLAAVSALNAERVIDEKARDLQPYGLSPAAAELVITEKGGKTQRLLLGDDTPTHSGAYAALAGDLRVFTIAGFAKSSLEKGLNDLRDKRFLTVESGKINRLELLTKNSVVEFDRDNDRWRMVKPAPARGQRRG
jgi:Domain of unknown function (DUF4340)